MRKDLKTFLPIVVGVLVILVLIGVRAFGFRKAGEGKWPDVDGGYYDQAILVNGVPHLVPPDELYENGLGRDGVPAITEPKFVSPQEADEVLADEVEGIVVVANGKSKFYSFQILNWHQIVQDTFEGKDILITYSPLCGSAVVYERTVESGETLTFGDSGRIYNNCPVLYANDTDNEWDQVTGTVIVGENVGDTLTRYPSLVMRWDAWRDLNPNGEVLSTETGFAREYRRHPYGNYDVSNALFFPLNRTVDKGIGLKDIVLDVAVEDLHYGFVAKLTAFLAEPNFDLGERESTLHAVAFPGEGMNFRLFDRTVDGRVLTFVHEANELRDKETNSVWNEAGEAIEGELRGKKLTAIFPTARYFALAYLSHYGDQAKIVGSEIFNQEPASETETEDTEPTEIEIDATE